MAGSARQRPVRGRGFWRMAALAVALACGPPAISAAATIDGVTFPPTLIVEGQILHLNGMGLRTLTLLDIHAYLAGLYLEHSARDAGAIEASKGIKALLLQYLRAASKTEVQDIFRQSEARYCGAGGCPASDAQDFERLMALFPPVKRGDYVTFIVSSRGLRVLFNNAPLVTFNNPDFARIVLDAYIGPRAASQSLRNALLGVRQSG
jgi:Chalcone isomerase-like